MRPGESTEHHVLLLHGYGADANDLFPLADYLDPEGKWTFCVPNAPLEVPIGPGWTGRGWFPISLRDLEAGVDFTQIRPPGMNESAEKISEVIFELNSKNLVMAGFSQGAMLSTEVALNQPEDVQALVLFSGVLVDEPSWSKKASSWSGKKLLQSHGTSDAVLPIAAALRLFDMLKLAGAEGEFISFPGGHEIPPQVLQKSKKLLDSFS